MEISKQAKKKKEMKYEELQNCLTKRRTHGQQENNYICMARQNYSCDLYTSFLSVYMPIYDDINLVKYYLANKCLLRIIHSFNGWNSSDIKGGSRILG